MPIFSFKLIQKLFFIIFFFFGLLLAKDYNISYDEVEYRQQGFIVLNHLGENFFPEKTNQIIKNKNLNYTALEDYFINDTNHFKVHHTFYAALEYIFHKDSSKSLVFNFRHTVNFIFSSILIVLLYKLLRFNFNRISSSIGIILFILSPRIYANFFFNPNDIMSMLSLVGSLFYLFRIIKKNKTVDYVLFSLFMAVSFNIRFTNLYIYPLLIFSLLYISNFKLLNFPYKKFLLHIVSTIILLYLITPDLWIEPNPVYLINGFLSQINFIAHNPEIMFFGSNISSSDVPFYYLVLWIIISSPILVLTLFFVGIFIYLRKLILKNFYKNFNENIYGILVFYFIFAPIVGYIIFKPQIFNGWRHFYFIYIGIIFFGTYTIQEIQNKKNMFIYLIFIVVLTLNTVFILNWSIKNHPYQNLFFNYLSKKYAKNFELDYWGLSNLEALNYLLDKEKGKIYVSQFNDRSRIDFTYLMLNKDDQKRIELNTENSKYWISNINNGLSKDDYTNLGYKIIYRIYVDNFVINTILAKY